MGNRSRMWLCAAWESSVGFCQRSMGLTGLIGGQRRRGEGSRRPWPSVLDNRPMHRSAAAAVVASLALVLPACGGGGPPATKADVEAQVREELPQQLQQQQNQAALERLSLAFGVVVRVVGTKCTPQAKNQFDCAAEAIG